MSARSEAIEKALREAEVRPLTEAQHEAVARFFDDLNPVYVCRVAEQAILRAQATLNDVRACLALHPKYDGEAVAATLSLLTEAVEALGLRPARAALSLPDAPALEEFEKATPRPWRVEQDTTLIWGACDPDDQTTWGMGYPVAKGEGARPWNKTHKPTDDEQHANAALIVAAVNAYDGGSEVQSLKARIEELEAALRESERVFRTIQREPDHETAKCAAVIAEHEARAALGAAS